MNQNNNLSLSRQVDTLSAYIQNVSSNDVSILQRQSKEEIEKELEQGYDQIQHIQKKIVDEMKIKAEQAIIEARAEFQRKQKLDWLQKREELLDQVFQRVEQEFQNFVLSKEYLSALPKIVTEAIEKIQIDQVILRFDKHSDQLIDDRQLVEIAETTGISLRRGEILTKHHGVIAESVDGRLSFENTLEARLERKKPPLRVLASEWLFEVNNG